MKSACRVPVTSTRSENPRSSSNSAGNFGLTSNRYSRAQIRRRFDEGFGAVVYCDAFAPDNDPYGKHDCAILEVDDIQALWKIDYFDLSGSRHSPNPTDPDVTVHAMTIMLAEEY